MEGYLNGVREKIAGVLDNAVELESSMSDANATIIISRRS